MFGLVFQDILTITNHSIILVDMQTWIMMTPTTAMMDTDGMTSHVVTAQLHSHRLRNHIHRLFAP